MSLLHKPKRGSMSVRPLPTKSPLAAMSSITGCHPHAFEGLFLEGGVGEGVSPLVLKFARKGVGEG